MKPCLIIAVMLCLGVTEHVSAQAAASWTECLPPTSECMYKGKVGQLVRFCKLKGEKTDCSTFGCLPKTVRCDKVL